MSENSQSILLPEIPQLSSYLWQLLVFAALVFPGRKERIKYRQTESGVGQTGVYLLQPMKLFNVSNFYCDCNEIDIDIAAINQIGGTANAAIDNNLWNFAAITINKIRRKLEAGQE